MKFEMYVRYNCGHFQGGACVSLPGTTSLLPTSGSHWINPKNRVSIAMHGAARNSLRNRWSSVLRSPAGGEITVLSAFAFVLSFPFSFLGPFIKLN